MINASAARVYRGVSHSKTPRELTQLSLAADAYLIRDLAEGHLL